MGSFRGRASPLLPAVDLRSTNFRRGLDGRVRGEELITVFDQDLDDLVAELDVHDRGHGLLPRPEQRRTEADADVGRSHLVKEGLKVKMLFLIEYYKR